MGGGGGSGSRRGAKEFGGHSMRTGGIESFYGSDCCVPMIREKLEDERFTT